MSAPSTVPDIVTANNAQVFKRYYDRLSHKEHFAEFATKLAKWLSDSRAYYDAARPEIVHLLQHAQKTLKAALGVNESPNAPFNVHDHPSNPATNQMTSSYIALIKTVHRFIRRFSEEDHLRRQVEILYRSTVNPAEIIDVDVFQSPPPSTIVQHSVGFVPSHPSQQLQPFASAPQVLASNVPQAPAILETLPQVADIQVAGPSNSGPSIPSSSNKRKASKTGSSTKPRKKQKKVELNWDAIRKFDESHHLGRQSPEPDAASRSSATPVVAPPNQPDLPIAVASGDSNTVPPSIQLPTETSELADVTLHPPTESGSHQLTNVSDTSSIVNPNEVPSVQDDQNMSIATNVISTQNTLSILPLEITKSASKSVSPAVHSDTASLNFLDNAFNEPTPSIQSPIAPNFVLPAESARNSHVQDTPAVHVQVKIEDTEDELEEAGVLQELIEGAPSLRSTVAPERPRAHTAEVELPIAEPETSTSPAQGTEQRMLSTEFEQPENNDTPTMPSESAQALGVSAHPLAGNKPDAQVIETPLSITALEPDSGRALISDSAVNPLEITSDALSPSSVEHTDMPMGDAQVEKEPIPLAPLVEASERSSATAEPSVSDKSVEHVDTKAADDSLREGDLQNTVHERAKGSGNDKPKAAANVADAMHVDTSAGDSEFTARMEDTGNEPHHVSQVFQSTPVQQATPSQSPMSTTPVAEPARVPSVPLAPTPPIVVQSTTSSVSEQVNITKGIAPSTSRTMNAADIRIPSYRGFDNRARMLQKAEGRQTHATMTFAIQVAPVQFESITLWNRRFREFTDHTMTKALCMSLACYLREDIERELKVSVYQDFPHQLYNSLKCVWPTGVGRKLMMKVMAKEHAKTKTFPLSPPVITTGDGFVDLGPFIVEGKNTIQIDQSGDMSRYTFCLYAHYPTKAQLEEVQRSLKQNEEWKQWLQHVTRPLELPPSPFAQVSA